MRSPETPSDTSSPIDGVPFHRVDIGTEEIERVIQSLKSGWLTSGPLTAEFERSFAQFIGAPHAIAVNSATAGLHLALEAIGLSKDDRVITTDMTFTATAEVIRYFGADPVLVDVDPATLTIDAAALERALDRHPNTKAVIPVHYAGQACEMDDILRICRARGIRVIEDAAHAIPTRYRGRQIGTIGDITVFSFYATKPLTTGEGGMVTTADSGLAQRIRTMRLHGISRDAFDRKESGGPSWYYQVIAPGYKYNLTDIAAAIGIEQLKRTPAMHSRRVGVARDYMEKLAGLPLRLPSYRGSIEDHAWHLFVIQLELEQLAIDRVEFIEQMSVCNVGTSVHYIPLHSHPYWRDTYKLRREDFPVSEDAYQRIVSLPIYSQMSRADVDYVCDAIRQILLSNLK